MTMLLDTGREACATGNPENIATVILVKTGIQQNIATVILVKTGIQKNHTELKISVLFRRY